jgi:hypothetical protein
LNHFLCLQRVIGEKMTGFAPDKELKLAVNTSYKANIYLSCSWRPEAGQDVSWLLVKELDQTDIRVLGDVPDLPEQDDNRIKRIMQGCVGFLVVLPYRNSRQSTTSPYIIREIRIAAELGIPIALFREVRVRTEVRANENGSEIIFPSDPNEPSVLIRHKNIFGPYDYDSEERNFRIQVTGRLHDFTDCLLQQPPSLPQYVFLITRLQSDFEQARLAIRAAVEDSAAIPCLWSDDQRHTTNIEGIRERTRLLIKHATFVVADLTYGPDSLNIDNPSRAHEVGIAVAYRKQILLCAQDPRRDPYFAASDIQMVFWRDEEELQKRVAEWIHNDRASLGRRVYNRELSSRDLSYTPKISEAKFAIDRGRRYIAPNAYPLSATESWLIAVGFGLIALSAALLAKRLIGFEDTFDFAAVLAGILTVVFASDLNRNIRRALGQYNYLRWLIPLSGLLLIVLWAFLRKR